MGAASVAFLAYLGICTGVIKQSIRVSLTTTPPWNPFRLDTGEAVIGVTLADPDVHKGKLSAQYRGKVQSMNIDVLAALGQDPGLTSDVWARGKLGQYVSGIVASRQSQTPSSFFGYNLVSIIQKQLILSKDYFSVNRFALSWMAIALCQQNETFGQQFEDILTAHPGTYLYGIGEASMITIACLCLDTQNCSFAANVAEQFVSNNLNSSLNVYTLGLGAQALIATGKTVHKRQIRQTVKDIEGKLNISETMDHGLGVSQILPPFAKRSFLDIVRLPSLVKSPTTEPMTTELRIFFTVDDPIITNTTRQFVVHVTVPVNPTLLQAMQAFQAQPTSGFSFGTIQTSLGPLVITVNDITRVENENFWFILLAPNMPLQQGVAETFPQNGERYIFRLTALNHP